MQNITIRQEIFHLCNVSTNKQLFSGIKSDALVFITCDTHLYRLDENEKLLEMFAYPSNNRAFYGRNWVYKTLYCVIGQGLL